MSAGTRAFWGALLGALLALLALPESRNVLLQPWVQPNPERVLRDSRWSAPTALSVPTPRSVETAAFSLLLACEELSERRQLRPSDQALLRDLARAQADREPENAFWRQMQALLEFDRDEATKAWMQAARANTWNDFQNQRIEQIGQELTGKGTAPTSWHYAVLARERSLSHVRRLHSFSSSLLLKSANSVEALAIQVATLENAALIRKGSRSISVGMVAVQMQETAVAGTSAELTVSPKQRDLSRLQLERQLQSEQRARISNLLRESDAWVSFMSTPEVQERREHLWRTALLSHVLPPAILIAGFLGAALAAVGFGLRKSPLLQRAFQPPFIMVLAVLSSVGMYLLTQILAAALATVLSLSLFAFSRAHTRSAEVTRLEAGARFQVALLAVPMLLAICFLLAGSFPAARLMDFAYVDPIVQLVGAPMMLWLSIMLLLVAIGSAPLWAHLWRCKPSQIAPLVIQELGIATASFAVVLLIIVTPLTTLQERATKDALSKMLANEPNYVLSL